MDDKGNLCMNVSPRTPSRLVMTVAFTITALLLGIIGAVAAGTGTVTPPPKIAFVTTNANVAPDALTVGPMAGRLGAPLFITNKDTLGEDTKDALVAYGADLIIVAGGPNTVTDGVLAQIAAATGLTIEEFDDKPTSGIIRAFGSGRDQTAAKLSELIANYNPNFLPVDATATDADLLDGKDSTEFLGAAAKAADADKLDGKDSTEFARSHEYMRFVGNDQASDVPVTTDDVAVVSVEVTTSDECGDGSTRHDYLVTADGYTFVGAGNAIGRFSLSVSSVPDVNTGDSLRIVEMDSATGLQYDTFSTTLVFTDVSPGTETLHLLADRIGVDFTASRSSMTVYDLGWTCS